MRIFVVSGIRHSQAQVVSPWVISRCDFGVLFSLSCWKNFKLKPVNFKICQVTVACVRRFASPIIGVKETQC